MGNRWGNIGKSDKLIFWAPKSLGMGTTAIQLKDLAPWKESYEKSRQDIKKQRHHFADKKSV